MRTVGMLASTAWVLAVLAACGDASPTAVPTLPPRPEVPDGWRTVTSDEGDLRLAVPQELAVDYTSGAIGGYLEFGAVDFHVVASAPAHIEQPRAGQSAVAWGERMFDGFGEAGELGPIGHRQLLLPAGPALELSSTWGAGTQDEGWKVLYLITTARGVAVLDFDGMGARPDADTGDIRLIRELVAFD